MRGARALALLTAAALAATACRSASGAVEIPDEELPFSLARTPTPSPIPRRSDSFGVVYLVQRGRLQPVTRAISPVNRVQAAMRALLVGPSRDEAQRGFTTAIPAGTSLLRVAVFEQIAEVDLSAEFQGPADPDQILLRIAQVVWTVVAIPGVTAVRFAIEGTPVSVVTDDEQTVDRPVSAPDYARVAPEPVSAPPPQSFG